MMREWKPGDVAMVNGDVCLYMGRDRGWEHGRGDRFAYNETTSDARPLVVIDPEDREQVERLGKVVARLWHEHPYVLDAVQAALREFASPTPPRPEEPLGLGAVVEDAEGQRWVRAGKSHNGRLTDNWRLTDGELVGWWQNWDRIAATRVLSPGYTEDGA